MATELDPSIIAQAQQIGDPARLLTLAKMNQELRASQRKEQGQNALRQLFASPGALDAQGNPTPQTIQKTMQVDPETGMELRQQTLDQQVKAAQAKHYETAAGQQKFDFLSGAAGIATDAYKAAKDAGRSDADAASAARAARNEALMNNGGVLGDQDASAAMASPFDPLAAKTLAMANPDYAKKTKDEKGEAVAERRLDIEDKRADAMIGAIGARETAAGEKGWELFNKPDGTTVRVNKATGEVKPLDDDAKGLTKIGPGAKAGAVEFTPRTGSLMATFAEEGVNLPAGLRSKEQMARTFQSLIDKNPGKTDVEIADLVKKGQIVAQLDREADERKAFIARREEALARELARK